MKGFLLGAGFSFNLGMPLTDELSKIFKMALLRIKNMPYYKVSDELEQLIFPLLNNKNMNYEDIIGKIEVEITRTHGGNQYQELYGVLSRYLEAVDALLLEIHQNNIERIKMNLPLYKPITSFCKDEPLWIFSLNHDVMIEIICSAYNIPIKCGFNDLININNVQFEYLTRAEMEKNQFSYFYNEPGVNLIKLHGALDLFVKNDEKNYVKIKNSDSNPFQVINDLIYLNEHDATTSEGVKCTNEYTYYDKNKELQFLRKTIMSGKHKYSSRISHTMDDWFFSIFKGHINYVNELLCIGYSFQDIHVNEVLVDWIEFSNDRKITIVNPGMTTIPHIFSHLDGQVSLVNSGFLSFLNKNTEEHIRMLVKISEHFRDKSRKKALRK